MVSVKMRDVALRAGVSISTVSKVLSGNLAAREIPLPTIERVRQAAADLGYIPNAVARNLRTRRTHEIGLVLGMETYPEPAAFTLDGTFLLSLIDAASASQLPGVVVYPRGDQKTILDVSRYLDGRIEGLLVRTSTPYLEEQLLRRLALSPLPIVAIWSRDVPENVGYVDIDNYTGAYQAVQHLLELGHRCIAYVEPAPAFEHPHFLARSQGYRQALLDAQISPQPAWHVVGTEQEQLTTLLQLPEHVTAIFTPNDVTAGVVATILHTLQIPIPARISIVGFDDIVSAPLIAGGLTTVHLPMREMGIQAVRNLNALIGGAPVAECRTILPTSLVVRNSSAPPERR